jgi:hypothetical protein
MRLAVLIAGLGLAALPATATEGGPAPAPTLLGPICHAEAPPDIAGPHKLVMLDGMGNDRMGADTANPEAQRWFDYGLTLDRSFQHGDAALAFQKAQALDPHCSLCVWGEAYARGPTINFGIDPGRRAALLALARKAQAMGAGGASRQAKALEYALVLRYQPDAVAGDRAWADEMDAMQRAAPTDIETAIFDAEAWIILAGDGDASANQHAVDVLKPLVPLHPDASGLVHFFIHATENAGVPELAAPYAARLAELAPNASHMVHMPSHTEFRVGEYAEAVEANLDALAADRRYAERTDFPTPLGGLIYHAHDIKFGLAAAMMDGDGAAARRFIAQFDHDFPTKDAATRSNEATGGLVYAGLGRYADPAEALAAPDTVATDPFLEAMRHYARAEAYLRLRSLPALRTEAALVRLPGDETPGDNNAVITRIARLTLQGDAAMLSGDPTSAIAAFTTAAQLQEARLGHDNDPPGWWFPVRRDLAAALLAKGDAAGAVREAQTVLKSWRLDPVTLALLARAEAALKSPAADADLAAARHGWRGDAAALGALS